MQPAMLIATASPAGRRGRFPAIMLVALSCVAALAGCGSSSKPQTKVSSVGRPGFLSFSACMRSNGITNFPDPGPGGGIQISAGSGINPFSPAFKAAQAKCKKLLPGGGPPSGPPSAQAMKQALETSECMRAHGVSGFPDPTTKQPSSPAGYSAIEDRSGVVIAIPDTINPTSPAYQHAASICHFG
jgi:hypothetical protein